MVGGQGQGRGKEDTVQNEDRFEEIRHIKTTDDASYCSDSSTRGGCSFDCYNKSQVLPLPGLSSFSSSGPGASVRPRDER